MSRRRTPPTPPAPLTALTGALGVDSYDSRALGRATANPDCGTLPIAAALGVSPDTLARRAHELGLGPQPDRGMSQIANQQGRAFDVAMLDDGAPVRDALVADGWLDTATPLAVINVNDHVDPPTKEQLTANGGKHTEQRLRIYMRHRARYTTAAAAAAMRRDHPTLLLRGQVETTRVGGTRRSAFGEFDLALIYPPGTAPPDARVSALLELDADQPAGHHGLVVLGDAKSWRKLGRLDHGDKRAVVAVQVAVYSVATEATWPTADPALAAVTVAAHGLVVNPPGHGGLSVAKLTAIDTRDARRALAAAASRAAATLAAAQPGLSAAVAVGARLDHPDPALARRALAALLAERSWQPSCLASCPLGQVCRRATIAEADLTRLGPLGAAAAPAGGIDRLHELAHGAATTVSEAPLADGLQQARTLLGPTPALPWTPPTPPADDTDTGTDVLGASA